MIFTRYESNEGYRVMKNSRLSPRTEKASTTILFGDDDADA